jgi:D-3-phosphoglycerate dehydrogenase
LLSEVVSMSDQKVALVVNDDHRVADWAPQRFADAGVEFVNHLCADGAELAQVAADADVVWVLGGRRLLTRENLQVLKRCGAIVRVGSGTDNIDVPAATEMGIIVANTPYVLSDGVADHTVALLLNLLRQVTRLERLTRAGVWNARMALPRRHPQGATLGLVGFGRIGQLVAQKLRGFEMHLLVYDPYAPAAALAACNARSCDLPTLLREADYVSLHCPLTPETRHLIGESELRLMPSHALLINMARGAVVDEPALIRALREGWIAGAALDVLEQEPPAADNPLLDMDNVVVTPHAAGYTDAYPESYSEVCVEAILDLLARRWPRSVVNPTVRPRWGDMARREA